jgi:hypothetical protein
MEVNALKAENERLQTALSVAAVIQHELEEANQVVANFEVAIKKADAENAALLLDAERLDFLEHKLFGKKWNGVIDSGSKTYWQIWSGYLHITHAMVGHTFRQAIDAARAALEVPHETNT